ncbi:hypothetical protein SAMN02910447_03453 [Ruminococcus sp. YE71]|uniref:hypothetical protein n=1 Tax=unclassified Ruminococcus TaxID=2608920 RepID=UPI0008906BAA|nr:MULTISPECIES: hypothetical protein [unclassified Ruminococcus]SDA31874.1 hypothetical protein SAMN02910446_03519 [Ruminococcus sp. YE78]SFW52429.1 hypothetical protein SAMN02910447_03453 [Ruminococcus sp. YE71]
MKSILKTAPLILLMLLSLSACNKNSSDSEPEGTIVADSETVTESTGSEPTESNEIVPVPVPEGMLQFQLGASGYAMNVPQSYKNGDVTMDELQGNQIAYYYSPNSDMDFDIYEFPKPDPEMSLKDFLEKTAADFSGTDTQYRKINGIDVGSYKSKETYDGVEYDVLVALAEEDDEYIEVVFWLDGETAEKEAEDILNSLTYVETYELKLGESPFTITVPSGYKPGPVTEEEAADDMIGYYFSESSPLDFDVYEFGKNGYTLEKYAVEEANKYEAERVDYRTINGIDLAFYYSYEESEGEMYTVANYLFENGDEFMEIAFWLDGEIAVKQTDRILSTLERG